MPSSLTMVLPIALVCSTRLPVSVSVRAPCSLLRGFSRKHGLAGFGQAFVSRLGLYAGRVCLPCGLRAFTGASRTPPAYPSPSPRRSVAVQRRYRNVRLLRIGYAFRPRLSSRLTLGGLAFPRKPWAYGGGVSRAALVTHASILTPLRSTVGRPPASPPRGSSPTNVQYIPPLRRVA